MTLPAKDSAVVRGMLGMLAGSAMLGLSGCGDAMAQVATQVNLACDDTMKTAFAPDANTKVLLVKAFKKGDALLLSGAATATTPIATEDACMVKLNVGPGNPGPADAPSTSAGIGIEIWLPTPAKWNNRIHVYGGGGWAGTPEGSITTIPGAGGDGAYSKSTTAMVEGAVSATTDTGHVGNPAGIDGSFAMNPDGTINTVLWQDFSERAIHEMALKTKALTKAYYGRDAKYSYWDGGSTGGRQALKEAQVNPADFDGILAAFPAINWSKMATAELYPKIVYQRDLAGAGLSTDQLNLLSSSATAACDVVGGQHLGYIPEPAQCNYNPLKDAAILCSGQRSANVVGTNTTAACVTVAQATAANKIWYGQTSNGSVPDPARDNGGGIKLAPGQKWFGLLRGTDLTPLAGDKPMPIATAQIALELQNPLLGGRFFKNATGNGTDAWKNLTYADLAHAADRGIALQTAFSNINTDNPDLSAFKARNGKLLMHHGLADRLIPAQGSINYYHRVAAQMGGFESIQSFFRFYLVPGMGHGWINGASNPNANPPLPSGSQLYALMTDWVEKGIAPGTITSTAPATATTAAKSRPMCLYPLKATYTGGDPNQAASYTCS